MNRFRLTALSAAIGWLSTCFLLAAAPTQDAHGQQANDAASGADEFIRVVSAVADTVLQRHIDPPTRQEMVLEGVRAMLAKAGREVPVGLGRRISSLEGDAQWRKLLTEMWELVRSNREVDPTELRAQMITGMLATVPGEPFWDPMEAVAVEEQLRANRYVGIGIRFRAGERFPVIVDTFRRGPARQAGVLPRDLVLSVDGVTTEGKALREVADMLRGAEGTDVTIVVRQPMAQEDRTLRMTRGVVPIDTILGNHQAKDGTWSYRTETNGPIAYLKIHEMRASTLHELRRLEEQLRDEGLGALILDLRLSYGGDVLQAVFLADAFLPAGRIGSVRDTKGTREFEADADGLFRDWPMVVLVGPGTSGESEWLAAALQDNARAVLVGQPTLGRGYATKLVELPDGLGALEDMRVAMLRRADGRSLARPAWPLADGRFESAQVARIENPPGAAQRSAWGVSPDHVVPPPPDSSEEIFGDAALDKARELLTAALAEQAKRER